MKLENSGPALPLVLLVGALALAPVDAGHGVPPPAGDGLTTRVLSDTQTDSPSALQPTSQPAASTSATQHATQPTDDQPPTSRPADGDEPARTAVPSALADFEQAIVRLVEGASPWTVALAVERKPLPAAAAPAAARADPLTMGGSDVSGSGVILRADGLILTSQHVIADAATIRVTLQDGRRFRARRVAADPRADLAVIRIAAGELPAAPLGNAAGLRRGAIVLALGNPLGLAADGQAAASLGIVSAMARPLPEAFGRDEDRYYGDMIQTSAQIHPGHSGGPLVDSGGRVVGIVTAASLPATGGEPIAFAVPITPRTRAVIDKLLAGEEPVYGYAGVRVGSLTELRAPSESPRRGGVLLETVFADGPAYDAGLRSGDVVSAIDGASIASADDFVQRVGAAGPDRTVEMTYARGGRQERARVMLSRRPIAPPAQPCISPFVFRGATLAGLDAAVREAGHLPDHALIVLMVSAGSAADRAGLTPGDIVVRIEGRPVSPEVARQLADAAGDVLLGLSHGGGVLVGK